MNEEIKEILENIKKCCEIQKDNSFVVYQKQDIEKTLNYITNLQEENLKLKETNEEHRKINGQLQEENKFLKDYKNAYGNVLIANKMLEKENQKLVKVIDEIKFVFDNPENYFSDGCNCREIEDILNKLTKLKGDKDVEN